MSGGIWGFGEATVLVAGHQIRVLEISPKHVRVSIIGPAAPRASGETLVLNLRLRRGQWHGTWDETGEQAGPFDSIKTVVAAVSEALAECGPRARAPKRARPTCTPVSPRGSEPNGASS